MHAHSIRELYEFAPEETLTTSSKADMLIKQGALNEAEYIDMGDFPIPKGAGWVVLHGPAKFAFGQSGGGERWVLIDRDSDVVVSIEDRVDARTLNPIRQESATIMYNEARETAL